MNPIPLLLLATLNPQEPTPKVNPFAFRSAFRFEGGEMNEFPRMPDGTILGLISVRRRAKNKPTATWDECGRLLPSSAKPIPIAEKVPGRKLREFVFNSTVGQTITAAVPPGAKIIQIVRDRTTAFVTASFPMDARVTTIRMGFPQDDGTLLRAVPFEPYHGFTPGEGAEADRFGAPLRWFSVPRPKEKAQFRLIGASGERLPLVGQMERAGEDKMFIATWDAQADAVRKVEIWSMEPGWLDYDNVILDPAPPITPRPKAPVMTLDLEGRGKALLLQVACLTPGLPYRAWAVDGGAPRLKLPNDGRVGERTPEPVRSLELFTRFDWRDAKAAKPHYLWQFADGLNSRGAMVFDNGHDRVFFDAPTTLKRTDIRLGYAFGPAKLAVDETLGGEVLKAKVIANPSPIYTQVNTVTLRYALPAKFRDLDLSFEVLDHEGRPLKQLSSGGTIWAPHENVDAKWEAQFEGTAPDAARIRLLTRPWHWTTFKGVPLRPRS